MNSAYFHRVVSTRRCSNHIYFLLDTSGNKIERRTDLHAHIVDFYSELLGARSSNDNLVDILRGLILFRCREGIKRDLVKQPLPVDVKDTLFSLPRNKAPGPDGYPSEFFTGCWEFVGTDFVEAVLEFFSSGKILK